MAGVICPYCAAPTPVVPVAVEREGILLDRSTRSTTIRERVQVELMLDNDVAICTCAACERVFVAVSVRNKWEAVWPLATEVVPEQVPFPVRSAVTESRQALAAGALGACLLMNKTAIIRLLRDREAASLRGLFEKGQISQLLYGQADEVRLWANVVGHEDFDPEALTAEVCQELSDYVKSLLDAVYIQPARLAAHKKKRAEAKAT